MFVQCWLQSGYWVSDFFVATRHSQALEVHQMDNAVVDSEEVDGADGADGEVVAGADVDDADVDVEVGDEDVDEEVDSELVVELQLADRPVDMLGTLDMLVLVDIPAVDSELVDSVLAAVVVEHRKDRPLADRTPVVERMDHEAVVHRGRTEHMDLVDPVVVAHMDHAVVVRMDHVVVAHMDRLVAAHRDLVHTEAVDRQLFQVDSLEVDRLALEEGNLVPSVEDIQAVHSSEDTSESKHTEKEGGPIVKKWHFQTRTKSCILNSLNFNVVPGTKSFTLGIPSHPPMDP